MKLVTQTNSHINPCSREVIELFLVQSSVNWNLINGDITVFNGKDGGLGLGHLFSTFANGLKWKHLNSNTELMKVPKIVLSNKIKPL